MKNKKHYFFMAFLLLSILLGSATGFFMGDNAASLKPLSDIFLNLIFTVIIPLVFFSVSSAIASMGDVNRLWKVMSNIFITFIFTGIIAAVFMMIAVILFPPAQGVFLHLTNPPSLAQVNVAEQLVNIITVSDFTKLFSRDHILALIIFATIIGLATSLTGEKGKPFYALLKSGTEISIKAVSLVMYYAPIGFFAYFAALVGELGPQLLTTYFRTVLIYYSTSLIYFFVAFTFYAYLAGKMAGVKIFWKNSALPIMTSLATCSSAASIPANLAATRAIHVPAEIAETVVPLGAILHKDGSVLGGIIKIAFLFGLFHLSFSGIWVLLSALTIGILAGTVMGAIPSGGMLAEILILSLYGFPPQALMVIAAISILIDPIATMLNVVSNTVCSMLVTRLAEGKAWLNIHRQLP